MLLRHLSTDGTDRVGRSRTPTPGRCTSVEQSWDRPTRFVMGSTRIDHRQTVEVVRRGSGWTVRLRRW